MLYEFRSDRREHLDYMQDQFDKVIEQARAQDGDRNGGFRDSSLLRQH